MAKGRLFAPKGDREGIWFPHHEDSLHATPTREALTSTGRMLSAPLWTEGPRAQGPLLRGFAGGTGLTSTSLIHSRSMTTEIPFKTSVFILAVVRIHEIWERRLNPNQKSLHQTDADFLKHYSRNHVDYDYTTISASSYSGRATCDPPSYRRFSRKYGQPQSGRDVSISTTTNDWFKQPHVPYSSSTRVLAVTQQPFPKHNPWKFSYKPVDKVYPPYDPTRLPVVDNIFNRYGAAFATSS
ncbi:uncharacterized protein LOC112563843 isoform X1 [Pomacea canaliculata]|uniref:uncharacterized protein LOC112563843 isoform X1 n=1 Tax=Pomacea canaliculata TaxID=400727 RepID=UPI000D73C803|nr:uncharacterized protein LOC112563843 isoform X1 [Pomacea canaliculata]